MAFKVKFKSSLFRKASAGGSGGDGGEEATPPSSPPSSSRPRMVHKKVAKSSGDCLFMSAQNECPLYIGRNDSAPLTMHNYLALRKKWWRLLAGKRTYLRPPKSHLGHDGAFKCPNARPSTLGCQEPLLALVHLSTEKHIIKQKIKLLGEQYALVRQVRKDGSSFYRAFVFSLMENLGQMLEKQVEIARLMERVDMSLEKLSDLEWDKAYFLNPAAYFSSVANEFDDLVKSVADGLPADELYKSSLQEIKSSRTLSLLRLLTEIEIRTREEDYLPCPLGYTDALEFCVKMVRPMDIEPGVTQIKALSNALGVPLRIEVADSSSQFGAVQVTRIYFFPQSEPTDPSESSPGKATETLEQQTDSVPVERAGECPSGNFLTSGGIPLVSLLYRPAHYDILYLK
ncbi:OVARIAN TUMOR DOMAIN-containing deubiquitinating enzyme 1-like isoform X2 [Oryza brachyantha]|uniref:ubiquitinyl hydrolase 1 n=1 Tax=Oryza brachyantha TaxID=4533 RepID=J3LWB0_ORYBR|nr:OVARIAN TUMOR DOMAIN-containing deubiquitinating enzyme 1-like isoform X2 [Oryza brachyantha]